MYAKSLDITVCEVVRTNDSINVQYLCYLTPGIRNGVQKRAQSKRGKLSALLVVHLSEKAHPTQPQPLLFYL
jgi:hypothetical protein